MFTFHLHFFIAVISRHKLSQELSELSRNFLGTFLGATPALAGDLGDWSAKQRQKHVDELPLRLFLRHPRGPLHQGELRKRAENTVVDLNCLMIG